MLKHSDDLEAFPNSNLTRFSNDLGSQSLDRVGLQCQYERLHRTGIIGVSSFINSNENLSFVSRRILSINIGLCFGLHSSEKKLACNVRVSEGFYI